MTQTVELGKGDYRYVAGEDWGVLPDGWELGDVGGVAVDSSDNVLVFNRSDHPVVVFDRHGQFLRSWGEGEFTRPHGIQITPDDTVYCTDDGRHTLSKWTLEGKRLMEIGVPGRPSRFMSGDPFCRCTHSAVAPDGSIFISDGYGNARIHKYTPSGEWILSWGGPGSDPGEFNLPHNITCDVEGKVHVADRENHRIQIFDGNGTFEGQWNNLHRPSGLFATAGPRATYFVGEIGPYLHSNHGFPNLGPRVSILDEDGQTIARLGTEPAGGLGAGQFLSPHGIAVDSVGDIYVGEVSSAAWPSLFPADPVPTRLRTLQKLVRVTDRSAETDCPCSKGNRTC